MARRRKHSRRRNGLAWFRTRKGAITLGVTAAAAAVGGIYVYRRRSSMQALVAGGDSTVTGAGGVVTEPGATGNVPKPISKASLPAEIIAGGVPLGEGWKTVAWYTYPEGQKWIRIDEYGDALFQEGENTFGLLGNHHTGKIIGRWRWVVVEGSTWIAKGELEGTYDLARNMIYNRYDRESAEDTMYWAAAMEASRWIDTAYGLK